MSGESERECGNPGWETGPAPKGRVWAPPLPPGDAHYPRRGRLWVPPPQELCDSSRRSRPGRVRHLRPAGVVGGALARRLGWTWAWPGASLQRAFTGLPG